MIECDCLLSCLFFTPVQEAPLRFARKCCVTNPQRDDHENRMAVRWIVCEGRDWLGFGGIAPPSFPVISREQQFAEKVHAYSLPREDRVNTRTKDLIDMLLLIRHEELDNPRLAAAIKATFAKRATHPMPRKLEPPPLEWEPVFQALAWECDLDVSLSGGFETVQGFVSSILGRQTG